MMAFCSDSVLPDPHYGLVRDAAVEAALAWRETNLLVGPAAFTRSRKMDAND